MRIAFACTGEGFGHVARTVALTSVLKHRYEVEIFCPRHLHGFVKRHVSDVPVHSIPYFAFAKRNDRIHYVRTVKRNLSLIVNFRRRIHQTMRQLRRVAPDAVVSDYDPFCSYAGRSLGIPVLQINHPSVVLRQPTLQPHGLIYMAGARFLMAVYDRLLVCSFYRGEVGPIIRREILEAEVSQGDYFVLYLKPSYRRIVTKKLRRMGIRNYQVFPDPEKNFVKALAGCRACISSAGHQFMTEAMVLGKPLFVIPQKGQYEQQLNAKMLRRSGRGTWSPMRYVERNLRRFIRELDSYPKPPAIIAPRFVIKDDTARAIRRIEMFVQSRTNPNRGSKHSTAEHYE
jgi:uncharacterized protein (TIGR00661 family)